MSYQAADGRWYTDRTGSDYHGFQSWRDCFINVVDGETDQQGMWYLEGLRAYAQSHKDDGEPIMPPSMNVWISVDGFTKSVQADDVSITDDGFTIGGIHYDGETWDFSNIGGGSGSVGALVVTMTVTWGETDPERAALDKTAGEILSAWPMVFVVDADEFGEYAQLIASHSENDGKYYFPVKLGSDFQADLSADALTDYPSWTASEG